MEELLKHKLSFDELCNLVDRAGWEPPQLTRFYYVLKSSTGYEIEVFDTMIDSKTIIRNGVVGPIRHKENSSLQLDKYSWDNPKDDAGFLNYFHAWGYCQLVRAGQRKEVAV